MKLLVLAISFAVAVATKGGKGGKGGKGDPCLLECPPVTALVCGTDGNTYENDCALAYEACISGSGLEVAYEGNVSLSCDGQFGSF